VKLISGRPFEDGIIIRSWKGDFNQAKKAYDAEFLQKKIDLDIIPQPLGIWGKVLRELFGLILWGLWHTETTATAGSEVTGGFGMRRPLAHFKFTANLVGIIKSFYKEMKQRNPIPF